MEEVEERFALGGGCKHVHWELGGKVLHWWKERGGGALISNRLS